MFKKVIWNQCEDAECKSVRSPLTVNRDNFISDLRFRVLAESSNISTSNIDDSESTDYVFSPNKQIVNYFSGSKGLRNSNAAEILAKSNANSWTLEIRKFSKSDEACYQCQLNSFKIKTIHYCLKLHSKYYFCFAFINSKNYLFLWKLEKVVAKAKKIVVQQGEQIKLKCSSNDNIRKSLIKWQHNDEVLNETNYAIEKKTAHDHMHTTLIIKNANLDDAGIYTCHFDKLKEKIFVDVFSSDNNLGKFYSFKRAFFSKISNFILFIKNVQTTQDQIPNDQIRTICQLRFLTHFLLIRINFPLIFLNI